MSGADKLVNHLNLFHLPPCCYENSDISNSCIRIAGHHHDIWNNIGNAVWRILVKKVCQLN